MEPIILSVPNEFIFTENIKYLAAAIDECLFQVKGQRIYKALLLEQEMLVIEISDGSDHTIIIRFLGNIISLSESVRESVARYVRDWFDLDTDLAPFYKLAETDLLLKRAVLKFNGLRNMGIPNLFEAICWGIIGQQINLAFAYTLKRRFVEKFGHSVDCEGESYWIFPTPQEIASLTVEDLTALRMTGKKSEYLIGTAKLIIEGKLTKEMLLGAENYKKAEKILIDIRGIGPWTANYVLMRCLRIPSAFPIDDVGLHNAIKYLLGTENKPTREEILQLSAKWAGWESYATFYLWRFLY